MGHAYSPFFVCCALSSSKNCDQLLSRCASASARSFCACAVASCTRVRPPFCRSERPFGNGQRVLRAAHILVRRGLRGLKDAVEPERSLRDGAGLSDLKAAGFPAARRAPGSPAVRFSFCVCSSKRMSMSSAPADAFEAPYWSLGFTTVLCVIHALCCRFCSSRSVSAQARSTPPAA